MSKSFKFHLCFIRYVALPWGPQQYPGNTTGSTPSTKPARTLPLADTDPWMKTRPRCRRWTAPCKTCRTSASSPVHNNGPPHSCSMLILPRSSQASEWSRQRHQWQDHTTTTGQWRDRQRARCRSWILMSQPTASLRRYADCATAARHRFKNTNIYRSKQSRPE